MKIWFAVTGKSEELFRGCQMYRTFKQELRTQRESCCICQFTIGYSLESGIHAYFIKMQMVFDLVLIDVIIVTGSLVLLPAHDINIGIIDCMVFGRVVRDYS